jgi:hypothetical protein
MANRYFVPVSGAGSWNATNTTNWSATSGGSGGASAPTTADNVIFDQTGTYTVTVGADASCLDITVTAGTINFTTSGTTARVVTIAGSMSLLPGTTWNISAGISTTKFISASAGRTITTYGATFPCNVIFEGGGAWSLGSAFNVGGVRTTTLTAGTLNLNEYNLTTPVFSSNNSNTRSIAFGTGNIVLANTTANAGNLEMASVSGFTCTGTGGFTAQANITRSFNFGGSAGATSTNAANLTFTGSGTAIQTINNNCYFNKLDFGTTAFNPGTRTIRVNNLILSSGGTFTGYSITANGTGTIDGKGKTLVSLAVDHTGTTTFSSGLTTSTSTTLTEGTIDLAGNTLTPTSFLSPGPTTRSITNSTGTGVISVSGAWTVTNGTGFTGSGYTIRMTSASAKTFTGGGGAYGTLVQAGAGALTIAGNNTFADIQATTIPSTITFTAGTTQTLDNFTLSGTVGNLVTINSSTAGTQFTMTKLAGTVAVDYLSIRDSNVTGGAYWSTTTSTFVSNNTGWNVLPTTSINGQFMAFF